MLLEGFLNCLTPLNLLLMAVGSLVGIIIGALPGLGSAIAMTLALPLTFRLPTESALILLATLYCTCTYGGSISAITLNTPGTPASGATVFDGYPMAQMGKADEALGYSAMSSFIGGIAGTIVFCTVTPLITRIVLMFGPSQQFLVAILSLTVIGALGKDRLLKGLIACGFGLMISFIGIDRMTAVRRFTYGMWFFENGFNSAAIMIGCFAISEMIILMERGGEAVSERLDPGKIKNVIKACIDTFKYPFNLIRSSLIGSVVGAAPALGVATSSFLAYMTQVSSSKDPDSYGKGNPQGIIAPEASNNAVTAAAMIPTLTLGIPGSSSMAIVLACLMMHGLVPGPELFQGNAQVVYTLMASYFIINVIMLVMGVMASGAISRITLIPATILAPCVVVLCFVGSFALRGYWQNIFLTVVMGFIGYVMKKNNYPTLGLVLGVVLGPIAEASFHRSLRISSYDYSIFYKGIMNQVLLVLICGSVLWPIVKNIISKREKVKQAA